VPDQNFNLKNTVPVLHLAAHNLFNICRNPEDFIVGLSAFLPVKVIYFLSTPFRMVGPAPVLVPYRPDKPRRIRLSLSADPYPGFCINADQDSEFWNPDPDLRFFLHKNKYKLEILSVQFFFF